MAAAHPLVASAGVRALAAGGNAVDAAVSAALVASVVMPDMCGLGGDLFAIVHDPRKPRPLAYLGSGIAPRGLTYEMAKAASPGGYLMPEQGPLSSQPSAMRTTDILLARAKQIILPPRQP